MQKVGGARLDAPDLEILVESFLKILIQIPNSKREIDGISVNAIANGDKPCSRTPVQVHSSWKLLQQEEFGTHCPVHCPHPRMLLPDSLPQRDCAAEKASRNTHAIGGGGGEEWRRAVVVIPLSSSNESSGDRRDLHSRSSDDVAERHCQRVRVLGENETQRRLRRV
nr:hypothetical protein Iba_chr02aCG22990 [Ipomoea batatas]